MKTQKVPGKDAGAIMLYALSTCGWCNKTKALLNELGVAYDYVEVDLLKKSEKKDALDIVKNYNPACSFPTLVINNKCIVGFKEAEIREACK